jgi:hypothetical protein
MIRVHMLTALFFSIMLQAPVAAVPAADPPSSEAWGGFGTGAAQVGTGLAVCVLCSPVLLCPGWGGCIHNAIVGVAAGVAEPVVGDWLGAKRGTLLWPLLASMGVGAATGIASLVTFFVVGGSAEFIDPTLALGGLLLAPAVVGLVGGGLIALVPALTYQFGAVDKMPGDTGEGFPGFLEPTDPTGTRNGVAPAPTPPPPVAPEPVVEDPAAPEVGPAVGY